MKKQPSPRSPIERFTAWVGSVPSLLVHTVFFLSAFLFGVLGVATWELVLLILTTVVSLEAIYLAIFIQMTVNRNTESLREVEEDVDEIQGDIDEIQEDVEDIGEDIEGLEKDVDEIQENIDEIQEDVEELSEEEKLEEARQSSKEVTIEAVTAHLEQLLRDLETLKKR